jgi:hypothetical protein
VTHGLLTAAALALGAAALISTASASALDRSAHVPEWPSETSVLFVDSRGDDAASGTRETPLRSISAALSRARSGGSSDPIQIHVSIGTYDAEAGERFPLDLTGGVSLSGLGSGTAIIDAGDAPLALRLGVESTGRAQLTGLTVRGSGVGLALGSVPDGSAAPREVLLEDVLFEGLATGVALDLGSAAEPLPILFKANGMRTQGTRFGLRALGEGRLEMSLVGCDMRDGAIGIALECDPNENIDEPRGAEEEGVANVWHDVSLEDCTISGMTQAGVLRVGRDGRNRGGPYRFTDCTFRDNLIGIEFRRPCLDSGIVIKGSRFLANELFGLRLTGFLGDGSAKGVQAEPVNPEVKGNLIQDCLFRWNGVGAHITSSQQALFVSRSSFRNNRGNGLYVANFLTEPTAVIIGNSLFARNGSYGIYSLADGRLQSVSIQSCTVVDNDAGGIRDHRRHSGSSNFALVGSIVVGNGDGNDLADMDPELARYCLVGRLTADPEARAAFARAGNLTDRAPRFLDRTLGDYRLAEDSPCRLRFAAGALELDQTDALPRALPLAWTRDLAGDERVEEGLLNAMGCFGVR